KKDYRAKKITLTYVSNDRSHILAQALQRDFKENLNLNVSLKAMERKTYYEKLKSLDYELALYSWIADFSDPIDFLNVFKYKDSSTNNTGWENESFIKLLEDSENVLDDKERKKLLKQAEEILLSEAPIIPIYHLTQNFLKKETLKDINLYPSGFLDLKYAYFE
nr:Oligopeptide-binding protein OppA [Candidatus Anoxychlamydiales bacterium]